MTTPFIHFQEMFRPPPRLLWPPFILNSRVLYNFKLSTVHIMERASWIELLESSLAVVILINYKEIVMWNVINSFSFLNNYNILQSCLLLEFTAHLWIDERVKLTGVRDKKIEYWIWNTNVNLHLNLEYESRTGAYHYVVKSVTGYLVIRPY